jgi:hypothetical protein
MKVAPAVRVCEAKILHGSNASSYHFTEIKHLIKLEYKKVKHQKLNIIEVHSIYNSLSR